MPGLRGEITEAPPIYHYFSRRGDVVLAAVMGSFFMGMVVFPFLMWGGTDTVLYTTGLVMLGYWLRDIVNRRRFNQELERLTKETE